MTKAGENGMKRGFTLIELLIVVVVIATLTTIIFRLAGVGRDATARSTTVSRIQRIENALSGYYAAFGTYPPVPLQGSRDIYQEVDDHHGDVQYEGINKQTITTSGENATRMNKQILAACRSQPFGAKFPFQAGRDKYVENISKVVKKLVQDKVAPYKKIDEYRRNSLSQGFTDGVSGNAMAGSLSTSASSWWGKNNVQLWRFGVMSFLLPRYLFMMQQDQDFQVERYAQWTTYNNLPFDPDTGVLYGNGDVTKGWGEVRRNYNDNNGDNRWKIELIPSQAACARWMPNLERICSSTFGWEFFGVQIRGGQRQDGGLNIYNVPDLYTPNGRDSVSQQYALDEITVRDGWGHELFYYSPPPHQTYRVWSSGADGKTFPPWVELTSLTESERRIVLNWMKDDIAVMKN